MSKAYFPGRPNYNPMIYAYLENNPKYEGLLKIGYTEIDIDARVAQQYPTKRPDGLLPYEIVFRASAMRDDGTAFMDHDVHKWLEKKGYECVGGEWFRCTINDVKAAVIAVKNRILNLQNRTQTFKLRPEQKAAIEKTEYYYKSFKYNEHSIKPKFMWNAKMRFGKTFTSYELAKKMEFKRILVLTFKPAVMSAWEEDLNSHIDFEGWQFISRNTELDYTTADKTKPIVCFGSFQDYLGYDSKTKGIKPRNEWVHTINWDLVIFDEYHFGAWRETAKGLFEKEDEDSSFDADNSKYNRAEAYDESWLPISADNYLYLSGTPFRALNSGEFIEEQIYNWTYSDEQRAKENWIGNDNPYSSLPKMVMLTYQIPEEIRRIAQDGEFDEFDLNVFFSAKGEDYEAEFIYKDYVQKWLTLIRGAYSKTAVDDLKLGNKRPPMPFSDTRLLNSLQHTFWFLPNVASCYAMRNLLAEKQNYFYHDYNIVLAAGHACGNGVDALKPVRGAMKDPLTDKTITLSCGKLTTGVTVKPWTGIFMLRNLSSPETYFQAAFRVQSPWTVPGEGGKSEIMKKECYIFDFALDRALRQISDYSCQLDVENGNPEKRVEEFINFLPVLAYDGSTMKEISASEILDMTTAGTSATLLAKRWESALLVNVDNDTLSRILANPLALAALENIEGFRNLNVGNDIETIINKSDKVKKAKKKIQENGEEPSKKEKKELTEEEKEYKSKRKFIQEKLIKFATRIPIFMFLTDYREYSLKDVIRKLEPKLFKTVTGISHSDFELLVSLGVFNDALMNDAVYKFKRYEDSSLNYTGIDKHENEDIGGWDTIITKEDYESMFTLQQKSLEIPNFQNGIKKSVQIKTEKVKPQEIIEKKAVFTNKSNNPSQKSEKDISQNVSNKNSITQHKNSKLDNIIGKTINSKSYGIGIITAQKGEVITVEFRKGKRKKEIKYNIHKALNSGIINF